MRHGADDPERRFDAVHDGHLEVHEGDIGSEPPGWRDRLLAVRGFANDLNAALDVEEAAKTFAELDAVVDEQQARGHTNQEIAAELGLSLKTVRNHVSAILAKLHVVDRAQAAIRAREAGLG